MLIDARRRILIAERPAGKHLAGSWEFPGGKIEAGETRRAALARELEEELGVSIEHPRPLLRLRHAYPYGEVLLDVFVVRRYRGEPRGLDGQALRWCTRRELLEVDLLPADLPIVAALALPEKLTRARSRDYEMATDEELARAPAAAPRLRGAWCLGRQDAERAAAVADFLVMREPLPDDALGALCEGLDRPVFARGIALGRAWALGASGVNRIRANAPPA